MSMEKEEMIIKYITKADLAVCILFYEKLDQTKECIRSFLPSGVKIYVLNNGSSLSSLQQLMNFCGKYQQVIIFNSDINLGIGPGRNYLILHTTENWLLFMDNDLIIKTQNWLQKFIEHVSENEEIEVFFPQVFNLYENRYSQYRSFRIEGKKVFQDVEIIDDQTNFFSGGSAFINRKLFDRLGVYDDKMFVGFEDSELCIRGILSGKPVKVRLLHDITIIHDHRQAKISEDKNSVLIRYNIELCETSFNRMVEKHNIIFEHEWRTWANNQVEIMLGKRKFTFRKRWKQWIPNRIKRLLKGIYW
jgi:GT2 family glycosyltransferase